jgi:AraC family transcriptional regulator of adaptative response / DNA-3-methyladenine glycosylase II
LIERTKLRFSEIAFAAGFRSIRQFNDTMREVYASTPSELRTKSRDGASEVGGAISLKLAFRKPFDGLSLLSFLGARAVPGVEEFGGRTYRRTLDLPHSAGIAELTPAADHVDCVLRLGDVRDLQAAVQRCRALLDLDADPVAVDDSLRRDPLLRSSIRRNPGRRVPGVVDGPELAFRAVLGQQVSVKGARTLAGRLVTQLGKPLTAPDGGLTHLFPRPDVIADADLTKLGVPKSRQRTLRGLAGALTNGDVVLDRGADRDEVLARLPEIPGIGPWTSSYIAMRALGDPDAFLPTDLGVKHAFTRLGITDRPQDVAERWKPWRAYALQHLWATLNEKEDKR